MKAIIRIQQIAISITILLLLSLWTIAYSTQHIVDSEIAIKIIAIVIACLSSVGFYRLCISLLSSAINKCPVFKKLIYGADYLEGTWIGFYIGAKGLVRYMVEEYEQNLNRLTIRGKSFDENLNYHSHWTSTSSSIDSVAGRVSFMYETNSVKDDKINSGIAFFNFERESGTTAPKMLLGFSSDLFLAGKRLPAIEFKLDRKVSLKEALEEAVRFYSENKGILLSKVHIKDI
ncbi:hypothetical protein [uncultured Alistipes sp.]|jgi:hypothetical protein|uniref:hypothetical protein n=1 Tax=uncultured Alistipes sp. TaxID=538949 RepID=UPI0025EA78F6|nr:hypothetical protein [uncultured Alistipes sp.]